jgi:hypothetical protein
MKPPRQDTHDEHAGSLVRGGKEEDEGGGVFPNEASAVTLATEIALRSSEQWALKHYLTMDALEALEKPNPQLSRHCFVPTHM